jgi:hypothetical protein
MFKQDGTNPLYLNGYGSYGYLFEPEWNPKIISLIDRGYVYAIAHIRGGGDVVKRGTNVVNSKISSFSMDSCAWSQIPSTFRTSSGLNSSFLINLISDLKASRLTLFFVIQIKSDAFVKSEKGVVVMVHCATHVTHLPYPRSFVLLSLFG